MKRPSKPPMKRPESKVELLGNSRNLPANPCKNHPTILGIAGSCGARTFDIL
jgi:hypothetical protein